MSNISNPLPVEIIRSPRRKKTVQARVTNGTIVVRVPAGLGRAEETRVIDSIVRKVSRKIGAGDIDLSARARRLARRFGLPEPTSISWSERQNTRWGSCTASDGSIRISSRLETVPAFVLDFVIVHELAHLRVAGHGPDFQALVQGYPEAERATGYLMAVSHHFDTRPAEA
ncbi:MAG: M48 family metallopeptidase [Acidimicrobiia bacterium]|nr:M48 family metallopeptidase [Acidimicrobiia bacterium]